jgi:Golgi SNAP receptor complex protein 1
MASTTGTGWAQLRQQLRSLESQVNQCRGREIKEEILTGEQTESLFHTYSQFASTPNLPQKPSEEEQRTEAQIQDLLDKVSLSAENMCFIYVDC